MVGSFLSTQGHHGGWLGPHFLQQVGFMHREAWALGPQVLTISSRKGHSQRLMASSVK